MPPNVLPKADLTPFEGRTVTRCRVEIPGAAGGLRDAMDFDGKEIAHEEIVYIALKVKCMKVRFDEIKDSDCLARVHVLAPVDGSSAMFVPASLVETDLAEHAERMRIEQEKAQGIHRIPGVEIPGVTDDPPATAADAAADADDEDGEEDEDGYYDPQAAASEEGDEDDEEDI